MAPLEINAGTCWEQEYNRPNGLSVVKAPKSDRYLFTFLQQIVTGDETWIHHYEPESKRQSMQWKHPSSPVAKKFKTQPSAGKLMLTVFWDSQGPILETYQERGTTVTSATYCDMLNLLAPEFGI